MNDAEQELLESFITQCRAARDPQNRDNRPEVAAAASKWELKFSARLAVLDARQKKKANAHAGSV